MEHQEPISKPETTAPTEDVVGVDVPPLVRRLPRKKSACGFKTKLGRNYVKEANKMSKKWKKRYLVYRCPYCGDAHMTTKIRKRLEYSTEVLHITPTSR
jgi:hypothetical protein